MEDTQGRISTEQKPAYAIVARDLGAINGIMLPKWGRYCLYKGSLRAGSTDVALATVDLL